MQKALATECRLCHGLIRMRTIPIGTGSLTTTRLAYGCWRLAGAWNPSEVTPSAEAAGVEAVIAAYEAGYSLFDNADIYCSGVAESILGRALKQVSGMRERILIATKCGIRFPGEPLPSSPQRYDFSSEHILQSCEQSLRRLGIGTIDLYQLHRPDFLMDPDEVAGAFSQLKQTGKVREFGVSNFHPSQVTALQKACPMPLVVHQVEISLAYLTCFSDGTLDQCLTEKMTPLAWSPLAGGVLGSGWQLGPQDPRRSRLLPLQKELDAVAAERGTSRSLVALAWLLKHPSKIVPIIGTIKPDRIREAVKADDLDLTREEWYRLLLAARGEKLP
jgi:predicted oxidoreductase